jgi:hypothetical protein
MFNEGIKGWKVNIPANTDLSDILKDTTEKKPINFDDFKKTL